MTSYHFVTSPIYETWSKSSLNLLAGEWCKIYKDSKILDQYNYKIAEYHWDDRNKYYNDSKYLRDINIKALKVLTEALNTYHKVNHTTRYWQILIGPWLHKFIHIIFDKYENIRDINSKYNINKSIIIKLKSKDFIPFDTREFTNFMRTDLWHHYIFSRIINKFFNIKNIFIELNDVTNNINTKSKKKQIKKNFKDNLIKKYENFEKKIFYFRKHDYFIRNAYLSIKDEIYLNFRLNKSLSLNYSSIENDFTNKKLNRKNFLENTALSNDDFFKVLIFLIREQLPSIFLESFTELNISLKKMKWPDRPKKIFTANAYEFDEYFKLYTAKNITKGSKLIIGQHGGFFGMSKWNLPEEHQINISDYFLSWGWESKNKKIKDGFIFTNLNNNIAKKKIMKI